LLLLLDIGLVLRQRLVEGCFLLRLVVVWTLSGQLGSPFIASAQQVVEDVEVGIAHKVLLQGNGWLGQH